MYRVFVVEDDAVIAGAVQRHLESWGYQVACADGDLQLPETFFYARTPIRVKTRPDSFPGRDSAAIRSCSRWA